jgi:hypothetical protein
MSQGNVSMQRFSIFRKGKHTAMSGVTLDFSAEQLKAAVAAYDPTLHEAPLTVGHPQDNLPAYGWVKGLHYNEETGEVDIDSHQVEESFEEMVEKGRFKKRSASWYLPDSPSNPKPGTLYLRHVAFLGAQPPAVKGLKDVAFAADDTAFTVEFADRWTFGTIGSIFRNLREYFIQEKDMETADRLVPAYAISELERAANTPDPVNPSAWPAYSEETTMTPAEIAAMQATNAALQTENAALKASQVNFSEQETALATREAVIAAREQANARAGVEARAEKLIKAGKMLPANKAAAIDFAMSLTEGEATIEFGEAKEKITQREAYLRQLEAAPKFVEFNEQSAPDGSAPSDKLADPQAIADKARELQAKALKDGKGISFTEAVALATAEFTAE